MPNVGTARETGPSGPRGAENGEMDDNQPDDERCDDLEYDEAHDATAAPTPAPPPQEHCLPSEVNLGVGGDYGYDEAHDLAS